MADLNVSILLKLIDQVTGPVRRASHAVKVALKGVQEAQAKADKHFERAGNLNQAAENIDKVGQKIRGVIGRSVGVAEDFEAAMSRVRGVTDNVTSEGMAALRNEALRLGAQTVFSASQAADAMYLLGQAGFDAGDQIKMLPGVLDMAAAGNIELARAAEISIGVLNGFGIKTEQAGRVSDVMAKAANLASVEVGDMSESMSYAAPLASSLGTSLEEMAAIVGLLGNRAIKGSRAGTGLNAIFQSLISPRGRGKELLEELKITSIDKKTGAMRPLVDVLDELQQKTNKYGTGGQASMLSKIFGAEALPAALVLMEAGKDKITETANKLAWTKGGSLGAAAEVAATNLDNAKGAGEQLRGAVESLDIALGQVLLPTLKDLRLFLAGTVEKITAWTAEHPKLTKGIIIATVALGGFLYMLSMTLRVVSALYSAAGLLTLIKAYGGVAKALKFLLPNIIRVNLAFLANPVVLIIAAILALIVAVVLLARHFDKVIGVWERFKNASLAAKVVIGLLLAPILAIIGPLLAIAFVAHKVMENWEPIKTFFVDLWRVITEGAAAAARAIEPIVGSAAFDFLVRQPAKAAANLASEVAGVFTGPTAATATGPAKAPVGQPTNKQEVGGLLKIEIDSKTGMPKVKGMEAYGIDLDVDAGMAMATP